jgi:hypothetical protein
MLRSHNLIMSLPAGRRPALFLMLASLAVGIFFLAYPNYVIRPRRPQGPQELQAALFVLQYRPLAEILCVVLAWAALFWFLRSKPGLPSRIGAIAVTVLVFASAALSRVNIYEIMFHPEGVPAFESVRQTKLDDDEKVLAVHGRAYPVRSISYHHIVNDVEGGVPIAVTY